MQYKAWHGKLHPLVLLLVVMCTLAGCDGKVRKRGGKRGAPTTGTPTTGTSTTDTSPAQSECSSSEDCANGEVCQQGTCAPCGTDAECRDDVHYGASTVCNQGSCGALNACAVGSRDCACGADAACDATLECVAGVCREPCAEGEVRDGEACREAVGCEVCDAAKRACEAEGGEAGPPTCGACVPGYEERDATCVATPSCDIDAPGSITAQCDALSRTCMPDPTGARCGACLEGTVEVEGQCVAQVFCADLDCEEKLRQCSEDPNGHCTGCVADHVEEGGACRPVLRCDTAPCAADEVCVDGTANADRQCRESVAGQCPEWSVPHRDGRFCVSCPVPCDQVEGSSGVMISTAVAGTHCACESREGYYLSPGEGAGAYALVPCDADNDGWVRDTVLGLKTFVGVSEELIANNRCTIGMITAIEIRDAAGRVVGKEELAEPLPMVESRRNDDDVELQRLAGKPKEQAYLPALGQRFLRAAELNGLTKVCATVKADFNDNGVPDVRERHEDGDPTYIQMLKDKSPVAEKLKDYTYFLELYEGWFEASEGAPNEADIGGYWRNGTYVIQERSRSADVSSSMALTYYTDTADELSPFDEEGNGGNNYWRQCTRFQDPKYAAWKYAQPPKPLYGLDFARYTTAPLLGHKNTEIANDFGHHSQFKCMVVTDTTADDAAYIYGTNAVHAFALNACEAAVGYVENERRHGDGNPADPILTCRKKEASEVVAQSGSWVGWGAVGYVNRDAANGAYLGGCVNESLYFKARCPGFTDEKDLFIISAGSTSDYGRLQCGCGEKYGGVGCDYGCPTGQHLVTPGYVKAPALARSYWLCGDAGTSGGGATLSHSGTGYRLTGHAPSTPVVSERPLSETASVYDQGYVLWSGYMLLPLAGNE